MELYLSDLCRISELFPFWLIRPVFNFVDNGLIFFLRSSQPAKLMKDDNLLSSSTFQTFNYIMYWLIGY